MLIMLIMLIKKVAQSCRLGNKAEFVHKPIGNMNQSKNLTLLTISRFSGRQLDYILRDSGVSDVKQVIGRDGHLDQSLA